jgi:hypothetical protein
VPKKLDLSGYDAGKKIKGRKRHILVDTMARLQRRGEPSAHRHVSNGRVGLIRVGELSRYIIGSSCVGEHGVRLFVSFPHWNLRRDPLLPARVPADFSKNIKSRFN